ncbi:Histone deacetylase hda1 [Friedmanniomyces endolithicus]|uniref:histone deacetylase n=1 Tax=Friedmanniomyces endolithicus TaxID=329885 RepID=A0AAN6K9W7_9PEZI|nr:Histone deacetylase hda1 [Friedmanniomyces endolithicus]KAK0835424.1 Histone deacetylase hda1 [Friedmanniomyces endolithicus]KAK0871301.1 Histone deacetylase hda1 [Friedmanniomyces endolithicus]KAK0875334.1 Histone deacetylase hda1 [Friedmanniomyces endolithicus]KAK0894026.1 Histone deacetylase hda1 [Friedmanniomyces endolithicus]
MDIEDTSDILVHDGDVLASTEIVTQFTQPSPGSQNYNNEIGVSKGVDRRSQSLSRNGAGLKGSGLKVQHPSDLLDPRLDRPRPAKYARLPYATAQTGLVYDVRMRFHVEPVPNEADMHPEDPRRIHAIFEAFVHAGLAWTKTGSGDGPTKFHMGRIDAREATKEEVCLVHTVKHWDFIQTLRSKTAEELQCMLQHPGQPTDSVYFSSNTPFCAGLSTGGAIEACRAVMLGKVKNAFAVIRPPGHHAEREDVKGFCFYDNVSIATKVCQREFGEKCRKVFILDWDVHHGNGIQQAHYDDPNVLYISLHVHLDGRFYPEGSFWDRRQAYGDHLHCGKGAAQGTNVNVPWKAHGMGDADYMYAFQQVVMPIATEFAPDLVIIAAGFDAAEGDVLGDCFVTPAGYAHMTHMLMSLAEGRLVACLEGGYNLDSIARSACAVARTMMGEPPDRLHDMKPTNKGVDVVKRVLRQQSKFWSCLYPKDLSVHLAGLPHSERMHDVVRKWQATTLWDEHDMAPLFIHKEQLSKSFENQVLATQAFPTAYVPLRTLTDSRRPNYMAACPLLIILHDPPQILASPDPRTGKLELHNTWLTDTVKTYVDWAVKHDFAVIDVNLPKHVTVDDDDAEHEETDSVDYRTREATQLLTYLWDNYVEINDSTHVILMGTNTGHGAIVNFIKANEERAQAKMTRAISFVEDVPFQSCKSATNEDLAKWYFFSSLVYISTLHNFWQSEYALKIKKRFGRVSRSAEASISDMLLAHKDEVTATLLRDTAAWRAQKPAKQVEQGDSELARRPPIGNFALSPSKNIAPNRTSSPRLSASANDASPSGRRAKSPRIGSPPKGPSAPRFAPPPRNGASQNPAP